MHFDLFVVGAHYFSSTLNAGSEANLYLRVEAWFGGRGNYFRVRRHAVHIKALVMPRVVVRCIEEEALEFSWGSLKL